MLQRERPLRCLDKCEQQRRPTFAHRDRNRIEESVATAFQLPAVESVPTSLRVMGTGNAPNFLPPQYGTDAGKQLSEAEWLYDIVVRSEFGADDAIDFVRCRCRSRSTARSAIAMTGALVFPRMTLGMTDASATRRPSMPKIRS
jgi:hypothetical protein